MDTFTHTSDLPYDQNRYRIVFENGAVLDSSCYENLRDYWLSNGGQLGGVRMDYIDFEPLEETDDDWYERQASRGTGKRVYRKGSSIPKGF